jgi:hypothetical protein
VVITTPKIMADQLPVWESCRQGHHHARSGSGRVLLHDQVSCRCVSSLPAAAAAGLLMTLSNWPAVTGIAAHYSDMLACVPMSTTEGPSV